MTKLAIIFRRFRKNARLTTINVLCMSLGLVAAAVILGDLESLSKSSFEK